jgi:hypothetical protein
MKRLALFHLNNIDLKSDLSNMIIPTHAYIQGAFLGDLFPLFHPKLVLVFVNEMLFLQETDSWVLLFNPDYHSTCFNRRIETTHIQG